jgi:hypothetical protein
LVVAIVRPLAAACETENAVGTTRLAGIRDNIGDSGAIGARRADARGSTRPERDARVDAR